MGEAEVPDPGGLPDRAGLMVLGDRLPERPRAVIHPLAVQAGLEVWEAQEDPMGLDLVAAGLALEDRLLGGLAAVAAGMRRT